MSQIRVFRCLAHMKMPGVKQSKFDDRSMRLVNLGKEPSTKAYSLYNLGDNKVYVTYDVKFEGDKVLTWDNQEEINTDLGSTFSVMEVDYVGEIDDAGSSDAFVNDTGESRLSTP